LPIPGVFHNVNPPLKITKILSRMATKDRGRWLLLQGQVWRRAR
jgi:hypothetical protein